MIKMEMQKSDLDLETYISSLEDIVSSARDHEENNYHLLLLQRVDTNIKSIRLLTQNNQLIDIPVLLRVTFEHVSRLYLVMKYKDNLFINHPSALQMMGRGPGPNKIYEEFGEEFRIIYEMLCSYSHPDMMAMILNSITKDNFTIKVTISLSLISIISILSAAYPLIEIDRQEYIEKITSTITFSVENVLDQFKNSNWQEQLNNFKQHPFSQSPFRREEMNQEIKELFDIALSNNDDINNFFDEKMDQLFKQLNNAKRD
jgi:hypothetical protein